MKSIIFVIAAFAAVVAVICSEISDDSRELAYKINAKLIRDYLQEHAALEQQESKLNKICPGSGYKLENVSMEINRCVALIDVEEETVCSTVQSHLKTCASPMIQLLEGCLPSQSRKIPSMVIDMLVAISKHVCKFNGEHVFELGNPCIKNFNSKTQRCIRRLSVKIQDHKQRNQYPSVDEVCEIFKTFRPCFQSHLNAACGHPITRESYLEVYDELISVCKDYELNEIDLIEPVVY